MFEEDNPYKIKKSLELLGIENIPNESFVLNEISKYIFGKKMTSVSKTLERVFDINLDYKYYFSDFLKYGINLNKDEIDWWEFNTILNAILLDENSAMSTVIGYRTYKKPPENPKTQASERHRAYMNLKRKYALPNNTNTGKGLEKLWGYLEKKVGDNKA